MGGEGGPGAAGGCGPASPPPPRDYLVPAAAMSPGRNVPPQIMLFISLGGSAAPQHQAPGGHCARSPVLPSSPCAAAPGLGVAAASAPAQVSPRGPRGGRELGASEPAQGSTGPRRRVTRRSCGGLAPGAKRGAGGVRSPGGPGGCGSRHPGTREPAWASQALGERGGASFGKPASRVLPSGSGSGFGVCVCSWPPPPGPSPGNMGAGGAYHRSDDCPRLCLPLASQPPGVSDPLLELG